MDNTKLTMPFYRGNSKDMMCLMEDGTLYISASHDKDHHVLIFIDRLTRHAHPFQIEKVPLTRIRQLYETAQVGRSMLRIASEKDSKHRQVEVVRLIREAVEQGASDVHFIVHLPICKVRFRIHGALITAHELTAQQGNDLCTTIYQSMCDVADSFYNPGRSQDARLKRSFIQQCGLFGARVGTQPTDAGILMVLRLLYDRRGEKPTLDALGYLSEQIALIRRMGQRKTGIHIFSGPTGSGKSTRLECVLADLMNRFEARIHLLTIEDPPEYAIPGANQTPILCDKDDDESISHEWARAISNAMRLDPDVMMIGEIRDLSSAVAAFRAAMTGHGVWTTLHTNDAVSILERLRDLGVDAGLLTAPVLMTGLVNQSLVRRLCLQCRRPYREYRDTLTDDLAARTEQMCIPENVWLKGTGCAQCNGTGIVGRMVIAEVIVPNKEFMRVFKTQGKPEAIEYWARHLQGITKNQHLIRRINEGRVDPLHGEQDVCPLDADQTIFEHSFFPKE